MKILLFTFAILMNSAWAQWQEQREVNVVKVLGVKKVSMEYEVTEESFLPNLDGYACPWPGIRADEVFKWHTELRHGRLDFDQNGLRVKFKVDREFCQGGIPTGTDVFGEDYVTGSKFYLAVTIKKEIVNVRDSDNKIKKFLKESVTTRLLGRDLFSLSYVQIEAVKK